MRVFLVSLPCSFQRPTYVLELENMECSVEHVDDFLGVLLLRLSRGRHSRPRVEAQSMGWLMTVIDRLIGVNVYQMSGNLYTHEIHRQYVCVYLGRFIKFGG